MRFLELLGLGLFLTSFLVASSGSADPIVHQKQVDALKTQIQELTEKIYTAQYRDRDGEAKELILQRAKVEAKFDKATRACVDCTKVEPADVVEITAQLEGFKTVNRSPASAQPLTATPASLKGMSPDEIERYYDKHAIHVTVHANADAAEPPAPPTN